MGKTVLLTEMIHNMVGKHESANKGVSILCGIGERCRGAAATGPIDRRLP